MAFVSGGSTSGTSGGGPTAAALLSAVEQHAAAQQDGRTTTPSMQTLAGERFIQQQQQSATAAVTAGHANPAAAQLNNFAGNAALLAAAQGQLALSQLLLNPLGAAAAQLLNPQALALYYAQLSALLQPGAVQAAIAAAAAGSQQQQQQAPTVSVAHPTATIAQRTPDALLLEQAAAQVQAAHASRINLTATRSVEQRQLNLTAASPESVKDHISRLISENEAILEPNPMLLKRRPYHRQTVGAQNSIDLSDSGGSQRGSPGPSSACLSRENSRPTLNVTQPSPVVRSVFEPFPSIAAANQLMRGGSLTSGQPIVRPEAVKCFQCNYCHVKFSNETALEAHEFRCSRRTSEVAAVSRPDIVNSPIRKQVSSPAGGLENRHPLKKRLLAAATKEEPAKVPKLEPSASASSQQLSGIEHLIAAAAASHNNDQHRVLTRIAADLVQQRILAAEQQAIVATPVQQVQAPVPVEPVATRLVGIDKPYTLMLPVTRPDPALPKTRNRPRHITSETFVCFNRTQPMFVEQKPRLSMYSNWQQLPINPLDAKLNLLYMSTCATRPRVGAKPYWRYTNANKEGQLRMTHSSYWELGHKLRQQLQQQQQATESLQPIVVPSAILPASVSFPQQRSRSPTSSTSSSITVSPPPPPPPAPTAQSLTSLPPPTMMIPKPTITIPKPIVVIKENVVGTSNSAIRTSSSHSKRPLATANRQVGGIRTDEVEVYVRGRGRGRYECERCGIKCKKPSMLKKHLKSHTDIRPFKCTQCNFSFKTKGNLTKHTQSKAHQRRKVEQPIGGEIDSDSDNDRLEIASPAPSDETNSIDSDDECSSENEEDSREEVFYNEDIPYRKFGQEHSLIERSTHTPPTLWIVGPTEEGWPIAGRDQRCHSAPPASNSSPEVSRKRKRRVKQLQQQQEDEAVQQRETAMEVDESIESSRNASSLCNGNIRGIKIEPNSISPPTVNNHRIGVFLAKEELACDLCNEVFRKASELQLHRQTHIIAQQNNARRGGFQCNVCKKSFRSKPLLHKHMEMDHSDYGTQMTTGEQDSDGDDSSTFFVKNGGSSSSSNPRSFVCTDCGVGFRKHGVLAKHLRSKMHVLQLDKLGKLPEDALTLITKKENGACLNEMNNNLLQVDTSDCERARASLIRIVSGLRGGGENFSSLECREQLTASPVPVVALPLIASSPVQTSPSSSSASRKRCESMSVKHFQMQSTVEKQRRRAESMSIVKPTPAVTMATGKQMTNTVWMPPKIDQLDRRPIFDVTQGARLLLDAAAQAENNTRCRSEEAASDSTGARSETSTPVLRNGLTTLSSAPSPAAVISNATKCYFCEVQFDSPSELRVHQHTDHVVMRDGNDFKCPRRSCDKVYPNRDNLRLHIAAHYRGGRITPINDGRDEETTALLTATDQINNSTAAAVALHRKLTGSISSQHAPSAPNHSPGVPEESQTNNHRLKQLNHSPLSAASSESPLSATPPSRESANHSVTVMPMDTIAGVKMQHLMNGMAERDHYLATCWLQMQQQQQQQALTSSQSIPSPTTSSPVSTPPPTTRLPCSICGACFQDAIQLQQHWLSHVCDRPHVCRQCDAGFTTADALSVHSATHHATPVQSS